MIPITLSSVVPIGMCFPIANPAPMAALILGRMRDFGNPEDFVDSREVSSDSRCFVDVRRLCLGQAMFGHAIGSGHEWTG
jgi:hypothetical protein